MMSVYEFLAGGELKPTGPDQFPSSDVTDGVPRWVRMVGPLEHELRVVLCALELPDAMDVARGRGPGITQ
jgi:hypothetical protein